MEQIVRTNCFHHFTTSRKPLLTNMHPCMKKISKRKAKQLSKPWITNESKRQLRLKIIILVPRGRAPFGQHQESRPLAVDLARPFLCHARRTKPSGDARRTKRNRDYVNYSPSSNMAGFRTLLCFVMISSCLAANFVIFPMYGRSHYMFVGRLGQELLERGHQVCKLGV